jgi:hypothetical protein
MSRSARARAGRPSTLIVPLVRQHAGDALEQRRLAGAVRADQPQYTSPGRTESETSESAINRPYDFVT